MTAYSSQIPTFLADGWIAPFSVARYQRMIETGVLTPEDRIELLENYLVYKTPRNPTHDATINLIDETLQPYVPKGWRFRCQLTVVLSDSQPEPDFAIARGDGRTYLTRHPTPADVALLIEVANTSLLRDQRDKARIYARGGVVCYWIVNLQDKRIEVHTQPSGPCDGPAYASVVNYSVGDAVPLVLDGVTVASIPVANLLP